MKVETNIITSMAASQVGQAVILEIIMSKPSKLTLLFLSVFMLNVTLNNNFQSQCQFTGTDNIIQWDQSKNVHIADKTFYDQYRFWSLSQARIWISNIICHGLFCVLWVQLRWEAIVRFVIYWWNWWPSLFKFSFHTFNQKQCIGNSFYLYMAINHHCIIIQTLLCGNQWFTSK